MAMQRCKTSSRPFPRRRSETTAPATTSANSNRIHSPASCSTNSVEHDGIFHSATDPGINGVTVTLTGTDINGNPVSLTTTTATIAGQAGSYAFTGLEASNGAGYTITETQPSAYLEGKDELGSLSGKCLGARRLLGHSRDGIRRQRHRL